MDTEVRLKNILSWYFSAFDVSEHFWNMLKGSMKVIESLNVYD